MWILRPKETSAESSPTNNEWVNGLGRTGSRPLTETERQTLQQQIAENKREMGRYIGLLICGCVGLPLVAWLVTTLPKQVQPLFSAFLGLPALAAVYGAASQALQHFRRVKYDKQDLADGTVKIYTGTAPSLRHVGPDTIEIPKDTEFNGMSIGGIEVSPGAQLSMDVLGGSDRMWALNGSEFPQRIYAVVINTALPHPEAALAAKWARTVMPDENNKVQVDEAGQRPLSREELAEISTPTQFMMRLHLQRVVAAAFCFGLLKFYPFQTFSWWAGVAQWVSIGAVGICGWELVQAMLGAFVARQYIKRGYVHVVRILSRDDPTQPGILYELLPITLQPWTENGLPAMWRRHPGFRVQEEFEGK